MSRAKPTKGQIEATISDAVTKFEKEFMGRGPLETKTYVIDDMVVVRLRGVLTKAEHRLIRAEKNERGRDLIKQVRMELLENNRPELESILKGITRRRVRSLHTDISTSSGERIILLVLDRPIEFASP